MQVRIHNAYSHSERTFSGTPEQVEAQLRMHYTFLRRYKDTGTLQQILEKLANQQAFFVSVDES